MLTSWEQLNSLLLKASKQTVPEVRRIEDYFILTGDPGLKSEIHHPPFHQSSTNLHKINTQISSVHLI